MHYENLIGRRFERLVALEVRRGCLANGRKTKIHWKCLCDCGNVVFVSKSNLVTGHTKSCGCINIEATKKANTKHGHNRTGKPSSEYTTWASMIQRCVDPKTKRYEDYGGRGITVCERWRDFSNFIADMGVKPFKEASIERKNNDGNYEPCNCKWATRTEQGGNKRNNIILTHNGEAKTLLEWSKAVDIKASTLRDRYHQGWSHARLLEQKPRSLYKPN